MAQFFGSIERSTTENGKHIAVFRIPAFSKSIARQRAKGNARIKGLKEFEIVNVENVGSSDVPGQNLFDIRVEADR